MSQEQASDQRQQPPSNASGSLQQLPFVGPTPNMLALNPTEETRTNASTSFFYPNTLPLNASFLGNVMNNTPFRAHAPFPTSTYPFTSQYSTSQYSPIPAQRNGIQDSMSSGWNTNYVGMIARPEGMAANVNGLHGSIHSNGTALPPATMTHQGTKRSRLPSGNAPRKAPRKSQYTAPSTPPVKNQRRPKAAKTKRARERSTKPPNQSKEDSPIQAQFTPVARKSAPKLAKAPQSRRQSTPLKKRSVQTPVATSRKQKVILDEDDEFNSPRASMESDAASDVASPTARTDSVPTSAHTISRSSHTEAHIPGPHPRYEYPVPTELEGVRTALGPENWNEYLVHMENLWIGEITGQEFAAKTKPLCLVLDDAIRKRMNNLMAMKTVVPVLEQRAEEEQRRSQEDEGEKALL